MIMSLRTAPLPEALSVEDPSFGLDDSTPRRRGLERFSEIARALARPFRAAADNARAQKEASLLSQSLWRICVMSYPERFEVEVNGGVAHVTRNAQAAGGAVRLIQEELSRASAKAVDIAFRRPGVWSRFQDEGGPKGAREGTRLDEHLTTPLVLACVAGDPQLARVFLELCDTASVERELPRQRCAHFYPADFDRSDRDLSALLVAAKKGNEEIFKMIADRHSAIDPGLAHDCLLLVPTDKVQAVSAYLEGRQIAQSTQTPTRAGSTKGARL